MTGILFSRKLLDPVEMMPTLERALRENSLIAFQICTAVNQNKAVLPSPKLLH